MSSRTAISIINSFVRVTVQLRAVSCTCSFPPRPVLNPLKFYEVISIQLQLHQRKLDGKSVDQCSFGDSVVLCRALGVL